MPQIKSLNGLLAHIIGAGTPHELGRALYKYIDCGPWTTFLRKGRRGGGPAVIYYTEKEAYKPIKDCIGIRMGSIVEGSDVAVTRNALLFPFTGKAFDEYVEGINEEAGFYWERDNVDTYRVLYKGNQYFVDWHWGSPYEPWPEDLPPYVERKLKAFLEWLVEKGCSLKAGGNYDTIKGTTIKVRLMDKSMQTY